MSWRDKAAPLVERAIRQGDALGLAGKALVRHCNEQFPWGERRYHPYEIWKSEVKRQLGLIKFRAKGRPADAPDQAVMFGAKGGDA